MRSLALLILAVPMAVQAGALNDTGIDQCTITQADGSCTYPEDAAQGRDAAAAAGVLPKIGGGSKGFDFTKIANNGSVLPASATLGANPADWACTYDNTTGLMWEVKTNSGLRDQTHTYSWYDIAQGVGEPSAGVCGDVGRCDTAKFVADVNAVGLCGHSDWRLPTLNQISGLIDFSVAAPGPTIDATYFPNTPALPFWSGTRSTVPLPNNFGDFLDPKDRVWAVYFGDGGNDQKSYQGGSLKVRLVRVGQ